MISHNLPIVRIKDEISIAKERHGVDCTSKYPGKEESGVELPGRSSPLSKCDSIIYTKVFMFYTNDSFKLTR